MGWIKDKLAGFFAPKYLGAFARSILQAGAGFLLAIGLSSEQVHSFQSAAEPILTGVLVYLFSLGWSFLQKAKN